MRRANAMDNKEVKSAIEKIVVPKEKVFGAIDKGLKMSGQGRKIKKRKFLQVHLLQLLFLESPFFWIC